ncbi:MAG: hypothetical protein HKO07_05300 [Pseudomonadales bacterium]|nr:hypothetical protein [Pseudomonadales bacterium]
MSTSYPAPELGTAVTKPGSTRSKLLELVRGAFYSGDAFQDFRVRTALCIAAAGIVTGLPVLALENLAGRPDIVAIATFTCSAMMLGIASIILFRRVELGINIVLGALVSMVFALLWINQGVSLGFYVGLSAVFFLSSVLGRGKAAISLWVICIALLGVAAYMSHVHWQTVIDMRDPFVASGGFKMGLVILAFNLFTVLVFRDSTYGLISDMQAQKGQVARLNQSLQQEMAEKHAWTRALAQLGNAGIAVQWYYEFEHGQLRYLEYAGTNTAQAKTVKLSELETLDAMSWQAQILSIVSRYGGDAQRELSQELRCINPENREFLWYAMSASAHLKADGTAQLSGILRDITSARRGANA